MGWLDLVAQESKDIFGEEQTLQPHDQQRAVNANGPMQEEMETKIVNISTDKTAAKEERRDSFVQSRKDGQQSLGLEQATLAALTPPPYWVQSYAYNWHLEPDMVAVVQKMIGDTTCVECLYHGLATDVTV